MKTHCWIARSACAAVLVAVVTVVGCGVLTASKTNYPAAIRTTDGSVLYVEDVRAITDDPNLTEPEKAAALEDLGIDDDDLIQVLLTLPESPAAG